MANCRYHLIQDFLVKISIFMKNVRQEVGLYQLTVVAPSIRSTVMEGERSATRVVLVLLRRFFLKGQ
jgi:hypothetical protein